MRTKKDGTLPQEQKEAVENAANFNEFKNDKEVEEHAITRNGKRQKQV